MASPPAANAAKVADTQHDLSRDIFPFFSLPQEVRDIIYSEPVLVEEHSTVSQKDDIWAPRIADRAGNPLPLYSSLTLYDIDGLRINATVRRNNLLTVSKQLLAEYVDATKSTCSKLEVTDLAYAYSDVVLPAWAKPCSSIKFNISAWTVENGTIDNDLDISKHLVECCQNSGPKVAEMDIRINTQTSVSKESIRDYLNREWILFPHLRSIVVYRIAEPLGWSRGAVRSPVFTFEEPETLLLQLSTQTKRVEIA